MRAHVRAKALGLPLIVGSEFRFDGFRVVALARNAEGWGNLCECITAARRGAAKGRYSNDPAGGHFARLQGCELLLVPCRDTLSAPDFEAVSACVARARAVFDQNFWLVAELLLRPDDDLWLATLQRVGAALDLPLVAAGDVHMHVRSRKPLQDVLTAVRLGRSVAECGFALQPNAERHLRQRVRLASIYPPALLAATLQVAARCTFSLDEIKYQLPARERARRHGAGARRWPGSPGRARPGATRWACPGPVRAQIERELALIAHCAYEMYFLTVHDIVRFARSRGILCQGRGSAANSAVCYCLGITAVDPTESNLLFERFISKERREPPDIDVDFEHERREEVIQYIYGKYGRERAAIAAVVITLPHAQRAARRRQGAGRGAGAGRCLRQGAPLVRRGTGRAQAAGPGRGAGRAHRLAHRPAVAANWPGSSRAFRATWASMWAASCSPHGPLTRLVPVEHAAMDERSIIQWDKDDLDAMGLLKVDVLALGMLSALRRCLDLRALLRAERWALADIPRNDAATYDMICAADTVGVFQIESRAQMGMLPRLKPRVFYDLVIEVAIVRPGPIQGGMVHPYLQARERQRQGLPLQLREARSSKPALERTLGVPIFQEQVMQIAMIAAGFTPGEADDLRRSMAAWKRKGGVRPFRDSLAGRHGRRRATAPHLPRPSSSRSWASANTAFPKAMPHSFALLVYASSWLKCHEPACFLAALLNCAAHGFLSARRSWCRTRAATACEVRPIDVTPQRLGLHARGRAAAFAATAGRARRHRVRTAAPACRAPGPAPCRTLRADAAERLVCARAQAPFASTEDLALRARLDATDLQALAAADALQALSGHRRQQVWDAAAQQRPPALLQDVPVHEAPLALPAAPEGEEIVFDYAATGLTLRRHPLALLRDRLARWRLLTRGNWHRCPMAGACAPAASSPCASARGPPRARCSSRSRTRPARQRHRLAGLGRALARRAAACAPAGGGRPLAMQRRPSRGRGRGAPSGGAALQGPHAAAGAPGRRAAGQPRLPLTQGRAAARSRRFFRCFALKR